MGRSASQRKSRPCGRQSRHFFQNGAKEATILEHLYNIAQWIFEHGKSELFTVPDIAPLPLEKLLPEKQYVF